MNSAIDRPVSLFHRDVDPQSNCGGRVATTHAEALFSKDYWCGYCGAKWNRPSQERKAGRKS